MTYKQLKCAYCKKIFERKIKDIRRKNKLYYYSSKYFHTSRRSKDIKKSKNQFCSKSCAAIYNNAHKTKGTKTSKLEVWLSEQLPKLYPSLEFHFNRKDAIKSELDIYIPSLKLAFELNGVFYYEPIFGKEKLASIQNNDNRKFQACLEKEIELCIIDTSQQTYFKPKTSQKYLDIICNIINIKTSGDDEN